MELLTSSHTSASGLYKATPDNHSLIQARSVVCT